MPGSSISRPPARSPRPGMASSSGGPGHASRSASGRSRLGARSFARRPRRPVAALSGFEPPDRGFAERSRARIRNGTLYSPPRYRNDAEQPAGGSAEADAGGERRRDLRRPLLGVGSVPVGLPQPQHEPQLVAGEHGQVDAVEEDGRPHEPAPAA